MSTLDIICFYYMVNAEKYHFGRALAKHLMNMGSKTVENLYGGLYVTQLARYFNVKLNELTNCGILDPLFVEI